ncbi:hypothetical protein C1645_735819 [Glomus cerebriforme]|uniref:Uncharacterized protein n=1 Tax=Glomus cerebriforme TaxID=658196 RepID=A0A397TDZ4_9GLOM|nr:hypothetical protein C1645_735819 [Glomus cerebriforme]
MTSVITEKESPKKLSPNKHWCNNQIPEQFIKERNMQTESTNINKCIRADTVYRYYEDTDTLSVYFAKASSGVVSYCREVDKNILVSYDRDDKIVSVEIYGASELLCCRLFDIPKSIDDKPPLSFYPICYEDYDELKVFLVSEISSITFRKTKEKDFDMDIDDKKKIIALLFHNANNRIAKTLPEKEREKLAEEAQLRSLEIAKWSHLLD